MPFRIVTQYHLRRPIHVIFVLYIRCLKSTDLFNEFSFAFPFVVDYKAVDKYPAHDACNPSPCAANAECNNGICSCLPGLQGDPYTVCRPECVLNSDCPRDKACLRSKCVNPCPGTCAPNAICTVLNHIPTCSCPNGMEGNAFIQCYQNDQYTPVSPSNPCIPSPCGPNSQCREINNVAVCSCISGYIGTPPTCHAECIISSDCNSNRACSNQKCIDPCLGACGINSECKVINHNPICYCRQRYTGNALVHCHPIGKPLKSLNCFFLRSTRCSENHLKHSFTHLLKSIKQSNNNPKQYK